MVLGEWRHYIKVFKRVLTLSGGLVGVFEITLSSSSMV